MKKILLVACIAAIIAACAPKKTETTSPIDSVMVDSSAIADVPAVATLAFSQVPGYSVNKSVAMTDSVNFILLTGQEELDKQFLVDKSIANEMKPDFLLNYMVAVVCQPRQESTTITLDKVEVGENAINVFVVIARGAKQTMASKATQIFAIEKRDGYSTIQFYVNGKIDKSFFLTGM